MSSYSGKIISGFVIICYLAFGLWLIISKNQIFNIPLFQQKILGYLFIVFSILRGVMFYTKMKRSRLADRQKSKKKSREGVKKLFSILLILVLITSCSTEGKPSKPTNTVSSGDVTIAVDQSLKPIIQNEIEAFEAIYKNAHIHAIYLPAADVANLIVNDSAKLAVLTRPLSKEEVDAIHKQKVYPKSTLVGRGAISLIVHKKAQDSIISLLQLRGFFNGEINTWKDLNEKNSSDSVHFIFADKNASTVQYIKDSLSNGHLPKNAYALTSNGKVIDYVSKHKNAIGIIGVSWISDTNSRKVHGFLQEIKVMAVSRTGYDVAYKPFQGFIANKKYPLIRSMYLENRESRTGLATGFASFVAGSKGQSVILKGGLVPATMPVRLVEFKK